MAKKPDQTTPEEWVLERIFGPEVIPGVPANPVEEELAKFASEFGVDFDDLRQEFRSQVSPWPRKRRKKAPFVRLESVIDNTTDTKVEVFEINVMDCAQHYLCFHSAVYKGNVVYFAYIRPSKP